jgi:cytochrome c553
MFGVRTIALASLLTSGVAFAADGPPPWAYGFPGPAPANPAEGGRGGGGGRGAAGAAGAAAGAGRGAAPAPDPTPLKIQGSSLEFTRAQIANGFGPADWFPDDHPKMPDVVAHGKQPDVRACSLCHYPNGKGRAENAGVSGLPVSYFIAQMHAFQNGDRHSADARKANTNAMIAIAKGMTEEEIKAAAEYFGAMKWTPWIEVKESATVPKTRIAGGLFLALDGNETEPIGNRIIEVPVNTEQTEILRNPRSGFYAYAPTGSIVRGQQIAVLNRCGACHGADLRGLGPVPGIAGRSPSYMVRQMYDMQAGTRKGEWTQLMVPVVEKLSADDMLDVAAFVASR